MESSWSSGEKFFHLASSYFKSYHTPAAVSGNQKYVYLMDPSGSYFPNHKAVFLVRSPRQTMIIHHLPTWKIVLLWLKPCTCFFSALCQHKATDFNGLGYFYSSQKEERDHMFLAFSSSPSLIWLPYSLFIILLFFPFQCLSNHSLQGYGWDEGLFLPRAKNARSYLSLMLQVSICCSYMGQKVDAFLYKHRMGG